MAKEWRKALKPWTEPDGVTGHRPGEVYEIETDVVFDDGDLLSIGTHIPATAEEIAAVKTAQAALDAASKPGKVSKATDPIQPPSESEAQGQ